MTPYPVKPPRRKREQTPAELLPAHEDKNYTESVFSAAKSSYFKIKERATEAAASYLKNRQQQELWLFDNSLSLEEMVYRSRPENSQLQVPNLVFSCIEFIGHHLAVQGLYRVSGSLRLINKLKLLFCRAPSLNITELQKRQFAKHDQEELDFIDDASIIDDVIGEELIDVHAICGMMKSFFRELSEPLIPTHIQEQLKTLLQSEKDIAVGIETLFRNDLPSTSKHILYLLFNHFNDIISHENVNLMNKANIQTCFTLKFFDEQDSVLDSMMFDFLIVNYRRVLIM